MKTQLNAIIGIAHAEANWRLKLLEPMIVPQGMICTWRHQEAENTKTFIACLHLTFPALMNVMFELLPRMKEIIGVGAIIEVEVEVEKVSDIQ